jgi:hypothetical protein
MDCHFNIHKFISEKEMGKQYNTREMLLSNEKVSNFVKWIANKHPFKEW